MSVFVQIFLYVDVFFIGVIAATALRHAYAHYRPDKHESVNKHNPADDTYLPPAVRQRLLETAQANFETALERSAVRMQKDLGDTEERLTKQLEKLGTEIVDKEMERYRVEIEKLHQQTETVSKNAETEITGHLLFKVGFMLL